jgi:signal peptidase I
VHRVCTDRDESYTLGTVVPTTRASSEALFMPAGECSEPRAPATADGTGSFLPQTRHTLLVRRWWVWTLGVLAVLVAIVVVLRLTYLLYPIGPGGQSDAPTFPACNGRSLAEGFTYKFRDPRRGEFVVFHARGHLGGPITPDPRSRELGIVKRVVGVPSDTVSWKHRYVHVNGVQFDKIKTPFFLETTLGKDEYFVLGDNRTFSQDSRDFGPVPRDAIFAKVFLIYWPLSRFGGIPARRAGPPPGQTPC